MNARNRSTLRHRIRDARRLVLLAVDDDDEEELAALESMRGELVAARDAIEGLLDRLEDVDEAAIEANRERSSRTPRVVTRTS